MMLKPLKEDILTARRCLLFKGFRCDNKDCLNKACPLNSYWEKTDENGMNLTKKDIQDLIELVNEKIKECKESDSAFMRGALSYWRDLKKKLKEELKHASKR